MINNQLKMDFFATIYCVIRSLIVNCNLENRFTFTSIPYPYRCNDYRRNANKIFKCVLNTHVFLVFQSNYIAFIALKSSLKKSLKPINLRI